MTIIPSSTFNISSISADCVYCFRRIRLFLFDYRPKTISIDFKCSIFAVDMLSVIDIRHFVTFLNLNEVKIKLK